MHPKLKLKRKHNHSFSFFVFNIVLIFIRRSNKFIRLYLQRKAINIFIIVIKLLLFFFAYVFFNHTCVMFVSSISYKTCHVTNEYIDLFTLQQHPYEGQTLAQVSLVKGIPPSLLQLNSEWSGIKPQWTYVHIQRNVV